MLEELKDFREYLKTLEKNEDVMMNYHKHRSELIGDILTKLEQKISDIEKQNVTFST